MKLFFPKSILSLVSPAGSDAKLSILLFHKIPVIADPLSPNELISETFNSLLDYIQHACNVLPLSEAVEGLRKKKLPSRSVAITFDDGYADWLETVCPALRSRNLPATFFISTEQLNGSPLWHERILSAVRALPTEGANLPFGFGKYKDISSIASRVHLVTELQERLKYAPLNERLDAIELLEGQATTSIIYPNRFDDESVKAIHSQGFEIGAHTVRHPILNECTSTEASSEIGESREQLESIIRSKVSIFAYPNGRPMRDYRNEHIKAVKAAGYIAAVATGGGAASSGSDLFQLPRYTPWNKPGHMLALHLARNMMSSEMHASFKHARVATTQPDSDVRCLLIASTFPPINGGSAVVYGNLCEKMPVGSIRVLAAKENYLTGKSIEGWHKYDADAPFPIERIAYLRPLMQPPPANRMVSLLRLVFQDLPLYLKVLISASRIVKKNKINVICIGELVTGSWIGLFLRKIFVCSLIIYVHGEEVTTETGGRLHGNRRKYYLNSADKVIAVSSFTCDALTKEMGLSPESVSLIQNGVDTDRFTPGARDEIFLNRLGLSRKKIILTVGRLVPRKGIDTTIRAMKQVIEKVPEAHYVIVGHGEYGEFLENLIKTQNLEKNITMVGAVSDLDLIKYLRACDIFVMPNRTMPDGDTEGFGLVFREANATGKAVIGGRAGGAVEAVLDGQTGLLVDGNNPDCVAKAIESLLLDDQTRERMALNGLKVARENNTQAVADRFIRTCERLIWRA